jgi:periplasmic protein CpxP/Spy
MLPVQTPEDIVMKKLALLAVLSLAAGPLAAQPPPPALGTPTTPGATTPGATAPASAPPAPAAPKAAPPKANAVTLEARVNQRIVQMHQRLKITPEQEAAWNGFAQVMRENVTSTDQAYKARSASIATLSAPDNMRNFAEIEQTRAQGIQNLAAAFQKLYDGMSDDQKKTADTLFRHYANRPPAARKAAK